MDICSRGMFPFSSAVSFRRPLHLRYVALFLVMTRKKSNMNQRIRGVGGKGGEGQREIIF